MTYTPYTFNTFNDRIIEVTQIILSKILRIFKNKQF